MCHSLIQQTCGRSSILRRVVLGVVGLLASLGGTISPIAAAGDISYNFANYPEYQKGWSLSGTIVTDGVLGTVSDDDFLFVSITFTKGNVTYSGSLGGTDLPNHVQSYGLIASATELTLPVNLSAPSVLAISFIGADVNSINWGGEALPPVNPTPAYTYDGETSTIPLWGVENPVLGGTSNWVIATAASVPEPSSLVMGLIGLALIGGPIASKRVKTIVSRKASRVP